MAKTTIGGKRNVTLGFGGGSATAINNQNQQNQQNQNQQNQNQQNQRNTGNIGADAFANMTDQQKADVVIQALNAGRHMIGNAQAPDTVFQKFAHLQGIDVAPTLKTDSELDKMPGYDMYRCYSASSVSQCDAITANIMMDNETFYSDTGGSAVGRGIYFYQDNPSINALYRDIRSYGWRKNSSIVRAKMNPDAKIADYWTMRSAVSAEIKSGSKFGKALSKINDSEDAVSIYAVSKGYSAMKSSNFVSLLRRDAITMSYTYHHITSADVNNSNLKWKDMKG